MTMMLDFSFVHEDAFLQSLEQMLGRRFAFRAVPFDMEVRTADGGDRYCVNNISVTGLCMTVDSEDRFLPEEELTLDILVAGEVVLADISARVVRVFGRGCACSFFDVSRTQGFALDKLVLDVQKRYILQRKRERMAEEERRLREGGASKAESVIPSIHLRT